MIDPCPLPPSCFHPPSRCVPLCRDNFSKWGVLNFDGEPPADPRGAAGVNSIAMKMVGKGARSSAPDGDGDDDGDY